MTYWKLGNQCLKETLALRLMCGPSMMEQPGTRCGRFPVGPPLVPGKMTKLAVFPVPEYVPELGQLTKY